MSYGTEAGPGYKTADFVSKGILNKKSSLHYVV